MYEVTTATKTLISGVDLDRALACAHEAAKTFRYVEVKRIITTTPWRSESVKILMR